MTEHTKPANVALVGCGAVTKSYYVPALKRLEQLGTIKVTVAFDPNAGRSEQTAANFQTCLAVQDLDSVTSSNTDLAVIASPNNYHAEQALVLLGRDISVLAEKPISTDVDAAQAMISKANTAGKVLSVGHIRRFFPACKTIADILASGIFGKVTRFSFTEGGPFQWSLQSPSLFTSDTAGGGILMDVGPHALDLLVWWLGEPDHMAYADDAMGGLEANCTIRLTYERGFQGEIKLSRDCALSNTYEIECERGWLSWAVGETNRVSIGLHDVDVSLRSDIHEKIGETGTGPISADFQQAFMNQLLNVVHAVQNNAQLVVPGEEALRSLRLIERCYGQRSLLSMPWLTEPELVQAAVLNQRRRSC